MTPPKKPPKKQPVAVPDRQSSLTEMAPKETQEVRSELGNIGIVVPEAGIADRIKEARLRHDNDLSIEALSRMCSIVDPLGRGIAQPTLVRYEKGIVLPGARELRVLSHALGVSTDFLILGLERRGVVDMDVALAALSRMLHDRLSGENPLAYPPPSAFDERPRLIAKAKEPKPRK